MTPFRGFWDRLELPIIGLAPMDGVTDAAFRLMTARISKPALMMTEFTNVEGLSRGATRMLTAFRYDEQERPIVGQIYGTEVDSYFQVAIMLCHLGFDGIDINMGCPMNKIATRGSGAGLIRTPELAKEIVRTVKRAATEWANGITLEQAGIRTKVSNELRRIRPQEGDRQVLPVSVKTRIGYEEEIAVEWIQHLLEVEPANITLHGRTLKQLYSGQANWEAIEKAAQICKGTGTTLLGNGDVLTLSDAREKIETYGVDGVLVGRGTYGNPWFFSGYEPGQEERLKAAIEHSDLYETVLPELNFCNMRKHLGWYLKGFDGAKEARTRLMREANSSQDVKRILQEVFAGRE